LARNSQPASFSWARSETLDVRSNALRTAKRSKMARHEDMSVRRHHHIALDIEQKVATLESFLALA
jgi:hypothetical protein